jgi:hypothetical protein
MEQFFSQNIYTVTFMPVAFLFVYFLICISDKDITRVMVFAWGVILIVVAGITAYQLMGWHPIAQVLAEKTVNGQRITKATLNDFEQKSAFLLWFIPFFTGALGTNLISDALTKPLLYEKKFDWFAVFSGFVLLGKALFWTPVVAITVPFLIAYGALRAMYDLRHLPRRWRIFTWRYRKSYKKAYARGRFPWEPEQ